MERRRFFPSKRVQQEPGRTVELDLQLKPEGAKVECPPGSCVCDVDGVAWFGDWYATPSMENDWRIGVRSATGAATQGMVEPEGFAWRVGGRVVGAYVDIEPPDEAEPRPHIWRAVVLGRTLCDVQWTWSLDVPEFPSFDGFIPWWDGIEVTELAGSLLVRVGDGYDFPWEGEAWWATFRATATCAGEPVGTLELRPGFNLWNTETGLPPFES